MGEEGVLTLLPLLGKRGTPRPRRLCETERRAYDADVFGMGFGELLVVLVVVLLVFGPGRLPEMMGNLGKAMREFQKGLREPPEVDAPAKSPTPPTDAKREG